MDSASTPTTDDQLISGLADPNQGASNSESAVESFENQIEEKLHVDVAAPDGENGEGASRSSMDLEHGMDASISAPALPSHSKDKHVDSVLHCEEAIEFVLQLLDIPNSSIEDIRMLLTRLSKFLDQKRSWSEPENADLTNVHVLLPYALSVWKHALKNTELIQAFPMFPLILIQRLEDCERFEEMLQLARDSVLSVAQLYGQESSLTFLLKYYEARALTELNKYSDAMEIFEEIRLLAMKKSESCPSLTLHEFRNLDEALAECQSLYEEAKRTLGEDDIVILNIRSCIPTLLMRKEEEVQELAMSQSIYEEVRRIWGEDNITTLEIKADTATLLMDKGYFEIALEIFQSVYWGVERILGKEHPSTLKYARDIENCLCEMCRQQLENERVPIDIMSVNQCLSQDQSAIGPLEAQAAE